MELKTKNVEFYFGRGVGMIIEGLLAKAKKRLWIVSPWISEKYARALNKLADKNVKVRVVTSDDTNNSAHRKALEELIGEKELVQEEEEEYKFGLLLWGGLLFGLLGFVVLPFDTLSGLFYMVLGGLGVLFYFITSGKRKIKNIAHEPDPKVELHIFNWGGGDEQLHSKMYIVDDVAIVGSANLTESGLFRNIEFVAVIRDPELIKEIEELFEEIVEHPIWEKREIKDIYAELKESEKNTAGSSEGSAFSSTSK